MEVERRKDECEFEECKFLKGNITELQIKDNDCEIRADIFTEELDSVRVWGRVKSCKGKPIEDALVKLVKKVCRDGKTMLVGVMHTVTDCKGFYQFDICGKEENTEYIVIAGKAAIGKDRVIYNKCDCNLCKQSEEY